MRLMQFINLRDQVYQGGVEVLSRRQQGFKSPWGRHSNRRGLQRCKPFMCLLAIIYEGYGKEMLMGCVIAARQREIILMPPAKDPAKIFELTFV